MNQKPKSLKFILLICALIFCFKPYCDGQRVIRIDKPGQNIRLNVPNKRNVSICLFNPKPYKLLDAQTFYPVFSDKVILQSALFPCDTHFEGAQFKKEVDFTNSNFSAKALFKDIHAFGLIDFSNVTFSGEVEFTNAKVDSLANFTRSRFLKYASFDYLQLGKSSRITFYGALLPGLSDFSFIQQIDNDFDLTVCNFDTANNYTNNVKGWHYINLYRSDLSKVKIDYSHFRLCFFNKYLAIDSAKQKALLNSDVYALKHNQEFKRYIYTVFPYSRYSSDSDFFINLKNCFAYLLKTEPDLDDKGIDDFITMCFDSKRIPKPLSDEEVISIYEKEIKNFQNTGQIESADKLDIEYRDYKGHGDFLSFLSHIWNNYGHNKEWVFLWVIFFLFVFTLINFFAFNTLQTYVYTIDRINELELNTLGWRVYKALVYTCFVFFLYSVKIADVQVKRIGGLIYFTLIYICGIICIAYTAAFVLRG